MLFRLFYANAAFLRESLRQGAFPLWNPHLYSGVPFAANMQSALYYPFTYLFVLLDFPAAAALNTWLHAVLAAGFAYLLARDLELSEESSCLAGVVFACNGFLVQHYAYTTNYQAYVWLPLILRWLRAGIKTGSARALAIAAFFLALQTFAGHPQFVWYSLIAMALVAGSPGERGEHPSARRAASAVALVCALGAGIAAVQLLPALELAAQSSRTAADYEWATSGSVAPRELATMLVAPLWNRYFTPTGGDPHIIGFYCGLPVLLLSALALKRSRDTEKKRLPWAWLALTLAGFLLALGRHLPLYRLLYALCPPLRLFQFPAQALSLSCLGMAVLAAAGLERSVASPRRRRLLLLLCFADLWLFSQRGIITIDAGFYSALTPAVRFLRERGAGERLLVAPKTRFREEQSGPTPLAAWLKFRDSLSPNLAMAHGLDEAGGREELRYLRYDQVLDRLHQDPRSPWMNVLAVRHVLSIWSMPAKLFDEVYRSWIGVYRNPRALPRAYFSASALELPEGSTEDYVARHPEHDFRSSVLLEGGRGDVSRPAAPARPAASARPATTELLGRGPNHVALRVSAPAEGWVVLADAYAPGWRAAVDGRPAEIRRANAVQRAVRVPRGSSLVRFDYLPATHLWGGLLSVAGLLLALSLQRRSGPSFTWVLWTSRPSHKPHALRRGA